MNLARILEQTTSDLPHIKAVPDRPRLHPKLVIRKHQEHDGVIYTMCIPGGRPPHYFRMQELQYQVVQLFNGDRSAEDVVNVAAEQLKLNLPLKDVETFIATLEENDFWYHTPQERSVALCHQLMQDRRRKLKPEGDLSQIVLCAFDPDKYLTWVNKRFSWIYSRWFTCWSFFMLFVACLILGAHWRQVWSDSVDFYNFGGHGLRHFLTFLTAFLLLGAVHETAHGITCKHYGGEVHRIGAMLVYMTPCIFCDVSQAWVYGDRWERMMTTFFGVWSEVVLASYASVIWWATPAGTWLHELSYMVILSGGIFCVLVNWNPFAKMDGYLLFTEYFRMQDIKATTTDWLVSWIRVRVFHLPGDVKPISRLRAVLYSGYALLSGVYCYGLLLFFVRILYHIISAYTPQWAFLPAWLLALRIFRSRIIKLVQFMKELYLDKKDLLRARRRQILAGGCALLIIGLLPLRRERVTESFILEPMQRAVLRAQVPGRVVEIGADEGQQVSAGAMLLKVRDLGVQTNTARTKADYEMAAAHTIRAQLHYADYATAEENRRAAQTAHLLSQDKEERLTIRSPIDGVVITPRLHNLLDSYLKEGTEVAEVVDTSRVRARVFVPESEMHKLRAVHEVRLRMDSEWRSVSGTLVSVSPAAQQADAGMVATPTYQGIKLPDLFVVTVDVANPRGEFRDGMTGTAKIYGRWQSILGTLFEPVTTAVARRLW